MPNVALLNDTSTRYHHGCARVMRLLTEGLTARGATIVARSPARHDWAADDAFLAQLAKADIIVINGEGTLHHGAEAGARLLSIADHPVAQGKRLVLLNALYDENPDEWAGWLGRFDLISARDSSSASQLSDAVGRDIQWVPDLSLSQPAPQPKIARHGVIFGDSVRMNRRQELAKASRRFADVSFVPTKTLRQRIWRLPVIGALAKAPLYCLYNGVLQAPPEFQMPIDEAGYLHRLSQTELHVTGRFHAVCLSLLTQTPFLALSSTSGKIEKLLTDLGLGTERIVNAQALMTGSNDAAAYQFTPQEVEKIQTALAKARTKASALLDEVMA